MKTETVFVELNQAFRLLLEFEAEVGDFVRQNYHAGEDDRETRLRDAIQLIETIRKGIQTKLCNQSMSVQLYGIQQMDGPTFKMRTQR